MTQEAQVVPRATIHKKILDAAAEDPDASFEEIASDISGANTELIERVLNEYGDPAEANESSSLKIEEQTMSKKSKNLPEKDALSGNQLETLRAIHDNPEATQGQIGDLLDICQSTVNNRLTSIEQFEWENREPFVKKLFNNKNMNYNNKNHNNKNGSNSASKNKSEETNISMKQEEKSQTENDTNLKKDNNQVFDDPDIAYKVAHACMDSDQITDQEEIEIFKKLFNH